VAAGGWCVGFLGRMWAKSGKTVGVDLGLLFGFGRVGHDGKFEDAFDVGGDGVVDSRQGRAKGVEFFFDNDEFAKVVVGVYEVLPKVLKVDVSSLGFGEVIEGLANVAD